MSKVDITGVKEKALSVLLDDYVSLTSMVESGTPIEIFVEKEEDRFVINELIAWHKKYRTKPSLSKILERLNTESHDKALIFKSRVSPLLKVEKSSNEFPYYVDQLKHDWANREVESKIRAILVPDKPYDTLESYSSAVKDLSAKLFTIHNSVAHLSGGGESFTTANAEQNIKAITERDMSNVRKYKLGHDPIDEVTGGFQPGEVLMIVGNVNQGKSMVLANAAYNMWFHDKANILILTAEMQPEMFDDRILFKSFCGRI